MPKPSVAEYPAHYQRYIDLVSEPDLVDALERNLQVVLDFFHSVPSEKLDYQYAPGKWTIPGILLHISDSERVFAYRALRISRGDTTPLEGFDENILMQYVQLDNRYLGDLISEFRSVRTASLTLFRSLDEEALLRQGTANGHATNSLAIGFLTVGHALHHLQVIKERYLVTPG